MREICETHPSLRPSILERLRDTFGTIRASRVVSWLVGCCASIGFRGRLPITTCSLLSMLVSAAAMLMRCHTPSNTQPHFPTTHSWFCVCVHKLQVSCALWVLAEYSASLGEVEAALGAIHSGLGPLPLLALAAGAFACCMWAVCGWDVVGEVCWTSGSQGAVVMRVSVCSGASTCPAYTLHHILT